jgi:CrcB protein
VTFPGRGELPLDPDVEIGEDVRHRGAFHSAPRRARIHWGSVAAVAAGGVAGGLVRYGVLLAWPTGPDSFPWPIFGVNTAGGFILALLLVLALEVLPPSTYLRPALGTGFCGALTTFSSVATATDQLAAHRHPGLAVGYLAASLAAGLLAAALGIATGRSVRNLRSGRPSGPGPRSGRPA